MIKIFFYILIIILISKKSIEHFNGIHTHTMIDDTRILKYSHKHHHSHIKKKKEKILPIKLNRNQCGEFIKLNLNVHFMTQINFNYKNKIYNTYINEYYFETHLLPEINNIWKHACIKWNVKFYYKENIDLNLSFKYPNNFERKQILNTNISRLYNSKNIEEKMSILHNLYNENCYNGKEFNLYFMPFLGESSITFYKEGIFSFIGLWFNKGKGLIKKIDYKNIFAKEISKNLGYFLNLTKNYKNNLMGSRNNVKFLKTDLNILKKQAIIGKPKFNLKNKDMILNKQIFIQKDCNFLKQNKSNNYNCLFSSENINLIMKDDNSLEKHYQKLAKNEEKKNRQLPEFRKKFLHDNRNHSFY
jgi:hypothetical protein